ncbi:hypothetical protein Terro_2969 [Terriglobus roseus DSM 18391]|uniref:Uncharacterized protein n=1 Tax=Terriglobus roseus (strain DSM 18391 / NRRL B-41598 / KBS 63) TaxID=926566 RepID=I3ZIY3_TERRK|nr:hypothetical protein [Terriglobus roseus]AFL89201.1 hypothetical protein Terro_2969 [Terriglobus roseus DSM 18391]
MLNYKKIVARGTLELVAIDSDFRVSIPEAVAILATEPSTVWVGVVIDAAYSTSRLDIEGADVFFRIGHLIGRGFVVRAKPLAVHSAGVVAGMTFDEA